jgi:hypothetical protein
MPRRWSTLAVLGPALLALAVGPALSQTPGRGHGAEGRDMELVGHDDLQGRSAYQPTLMVDAQRRCKVAIQTNNVEVDERGFVYLADRAGTGLHVVRLSGEARRIVEGN